MNIKPAEQWAVKVTDCASSIEAVELIQAIQADVLRTAVHQLDEANYNVAIRDRVEQWRQLANQLDPKPTTV